MTDPKDLARSIIDSNRYMTLATADERGRPWPSPVYYAMSGYREFFWVTEPETTHSENLAARPELSMVIFDSHVDLSTVVGVYMTGVAALATGDDVDRGIALFSRRYQSHGGRAWTVEDVRAPSPLRLYRAVITEHSLHRRGDSRKPISVDAD